MGVIETRVQSTFRQCSRCELIAITHCLLSTSSQEGSSIRFEDLCAFAVVNFVPQKIEKKGKGVNVVEQTESLKISES